MTKKDKMLSGVNAVCRQCLCKCKQFEQVILLACPKFRANPKKQATSSFKPSIRQARKKRGTIKQILRDAKKKVGHPRGSSVSEGSCPVCQEKKATSKHHITPLAQGGLDVKRNIVYLCNRCHDLVEDYTDRGKKYSPVLIELIRLEHF